MPEEDLLPSKISDLSSAHLCSLEHMHSLRDERLDTSNKQIPFHLHSRLSHTFPVALHNRFLEET